MQMHAAAGDSCAEGNSYIRGGRNQWGGCCKKRSKHKTQASICKPLLALFMPFSLSEL